MKNDKKVLYINYMLQYGHINFDRIHINALLKQGFDVKVIVHDKLVKRMCLSDDNLLFTLPEWLDFDSQNGLINRIMYILTLIYIKIRINAKDYDSIIISNVEEMSLCLMPPGINMIIFAHALNDSLNSKLKSAFVKKLARNNKFVVFNEHMKIPFLNAGITNVAVISHGCISRYDYDSSVNVFGNIEDSQTIVFHPSPLPNKKFVEDLLTNENCQKRLEKMNAILFIRDKSGIFKSNGRIRILTDYLPSKVYQNAFIRADIILLAYPSDFLYKVSGVSYECLANKKKMLILDNPSFYYCRDFYNYDPMFKTSEDLLSKIEFLIRHKECSCIASADAVSPNYNLII